MTTVVCAISGCRQPAGERYLHFGPVLHVRPVCNHCAWKNGFSSNARQEFVPKMAPAATGRGISPSSPTQDEGVEPGPSGGDQSATPDPSDSPDRPTVPDLMAALEASLAAVKASMAKAAS